MLEPADEETCMNATSPAESAAIATAQAAPVDYRTEPGRYRHWAYTIDGAIATLTMTVAEDAGIRPGYKLKLNSYDLGVDIELHDAINRLRFEHPQVQAVVLTGGRERIFCSGANIFMLGLSSHAWKVNFCKFTNETRNGIEDASQHSGLKFIAALNGTTAGGGYELALACDEIAMIDDRSSTVSLPEVHRTVPVPSGSFWRKLFAFAGPGYLVAVGYMDPGNWATDLAGGARYGYTLLSVIMLSNLMAILLQALSARLGIASGRDLAQACRDHYSRPATIALWLLCEVAIAACDLAEVIGSAIALTEVQITVATVLQAYVISTPVHSIPVHAAITLLPTGRVPITLRPR